MHPTVSKGEIAVFTALSKAGVTYGMVTQKPVVLKFTVPDFCWFEHKKAVYLDGNPVHLKAHVEKRDEEINDLMEQRGWQILRIPYDPPLSPEETAEIAEQIRQFIQGK
jgi:very-short-patch-repair endonuclease